MPEGSAAGPDSAVIASAPGGEARGGNQFAFDLYGKLSASGTGNVFFSPVSISTALGMVYAGARGQTAKQFVDVLHFDADQAKQNAAMHKLLGQLNGSWLDLRPYDLTVANGIWGQRGYNFKKDFLSVLKGDYGAGLREADFIMDPAGAARSINAWVKDQTHGRIIGSLDQGDLDPATRMLMADVVYFKGQWTSQFEKSTTKDLPFHLACGQEAPVKMMFQRHEFLYAETSDFQVLRLPYKGGKLSIILFLPHAAEGFGRMEKDLSADLLARLAAGEELEWGGREFVDSEGRKRRPFFSRFVRCDVSVYLPKFTMETSYNLIEPMRSLGLKEIFEPQADLSGASDARPLYLNLLKHMALVKVDEEGTIAVAVTVPSLACGAGPFPVTFRADHPFIFLICDESSGAILFMGRMMNPKV